MGATTFMILAKMLTFLEVFGDIGGRKRAARKKD